MSPPADRLHHLLLDLVQFVGLLHPEHTDRDQRIPLSQLFALHELDTDTALSQQDLAKRLSLEKSTVSRLVADMAGSGLLTRERDPHNRRYYRLRITDHGRATHARMATDFHTRYERLLSGMSAAERDALLIGLPALIRVLRDELG